VQARKGRDLALAFDCMKGALRCTRTRKGLFVLILSRIYDALEKNWACQPRLILWVIIAANGSAHSLITISFLLHPPMSNVSPKINEKVDKPASYQGQYVESVKEQIKHDIYEWHGGFVDVVSATELASEEHESNLGAESSQ
jgi:hypothetical protein